MTRRHAGAARRLRPGVITTRRQKTTSSRRWRRSSSETIVSVSGSTGSNVVRASCNTGVGERHPPHLPHHLEAVTQVGQRLNVGAPDQRLVRRRAAAQPFVVVLSHVALGEYAVLAETLALRGFELRAEDQERPEDGKQHHRNQRDALHLELGKPRAGVENPAGHQPGEHRALRHQEMQEADGAVTGLSAVGPGNQAIDFDAKAVILASGGFEGNYEMLVHYLGPSARYLRPVARGGYYNKGEGIRMALGIGAAPAGDYGQIHAEPLDPRSGAPEPIVLVFNYGILINKRGLRFIDEAPSTVDATYENITRKILQQPKGIAYAVMDSSIDDVPRLETVGTV